MKKFFLILLAIIFVSVWWYLNIYNHYTIDYGTSLMKPKQYDQKARVRVISPNEKDSLPRKTIIHFEVTEQDLPKRNPGKYVSRIIGLPGEKVEMKESVIYINGQALDEPYTEEDVKPLAQNFSEIQVPADSYLVIADDRHIIPVVRYFVKIQNVVGVVEGV